MVGVAAPATVPPGSSFVGAAASGLSPAFQAWKAAQDPTIPIVTLLDIELSDTETVHLMKGHPGGNAQEVHSGEVYRNANFTLENIEENIEFRLPELTLTISNADGVAAGYIERNELEGRTVRVIYIPLSLIDSGNPNDSIVQEYKIQEQTYDRGSARVTLGQPNYLERNVPWRRFVIHKCQWNYGERFRENSGCFFPSDYFEAETRQDFLFGVAADLEKEYQHGWFAINQTNASAMDVDTSAPSVLRISIPATNVEVWQNATRDGPYVYKKLSESDAETVTGDFDVFLRVEGATLLDDGIVSLHCQGEVSGEEDSWVNMGFKGDDNRAYADRTLNDVTTDNFESGPLTANTRFARLTRSGDTFTGFYSEDGVNWTEHFQTTLSLSDLVRIGVTLQNAVASVGTITADVDLVRFLRGGLVKCDFTLEDCGLHGNTTHFLAFRSIPRRR